MNLMNEISNSDPVIYEAMLKELNADVWIVYKNPKDLILTKDEKENNHISKWCFLEFIQDTDKYINNNGTIDNLFNVVKKTIFES